MLLKLMRIIDTSIKANIDFFFKKNEGHKCFSLKVCHPIEPVNHLCCRLKRSIYTIYVSGKLGQGDWGHT